jgi:predicted ArsR family transcriptional regulator
MSVPRVGETQQDILEHLKRNGASTIPVMAAEFELSVETVRSHLTSLGSDGLVERVGTRRKGPGRPEIVYGLTDRAQVLFPAREGEILQDLAAFLEEHGSRHLLREFFDGQVSRRRATSMERVRDLHGPARLEEVARILSEEGFMAEVRTDDAGRRVLRLCHCPMRGLVSVTTAPCRAELAFVREMLGDGLSRVSYIPSGDAACCYTVEQGA